MESAKMARAAPLITEEKMYSALREKLPPLAATKMALPTSWSKATMIAERCSLPWLPAIWRSWIAKKSTVNFPEKIMTKTKMLMVAKESMCFL